MECYVCNNDLTKENETEEHIILNAIGGKLKSKKLVCKDCNSKFGFEIDNILAEQLNPIANLLDVKRDRGQPRSIKGTYQNKEILIEPGGKMKLARPYFDLDKNHFKIQTSSTKQARQVLNGLKRKYKQIDIEENLNNAKRNKSYLPSVTININFGGENTSRALCKMAVNYFIFNGGNRNEIKHLLPFINGEKAEEEVEVYYFYPKSEVFNKGDNDIYHSLISLVNPNIIFFMFLLNFLTNLKWLFF
ncbi:HNH endonuclease [Aquisalibacillus elongatus]|uniref:HNH endonuclease n=1 Tax=Aquisalibacillus elongatus TaxID=485577 RepID=UPI000F51C4BF|nr:HNH endonuclease [Aquisalibacillus elongatus]